MYLVSLRASCHPEGQFHPSLIPFACVLRSAIGHIRRHPFAANMRGERLSAFNSHANRIQLDLVEDGDGIEA